MTDTLKIAQAIVNNNPYRETLVLGIAFALSDQYMEGKTDGLKRAAEILKSGEVCYAN